MKKSVKQMLSSFLVIIMLVGVVPFAGLGITASAAETYSGTCGENLTWTLNPETGELVISGEGEMDHYQHWHDGGSGHAPWNAYNNYEANTTIKSIVVEDGVTSIGSCAFFRCVNLEKVVIADSVVTIEWGAFEYSEKLTDITIGKNVTEFSPDAFWNTGYYNDITNWENGVLYLDNYLLWYEAEKSSSDKIVIRDGTTILAKGPFSGYGEKITEIIMPDSVEHIGESAFVGCSSLESVTLSNKLSNVPNYAFEGCYSLTDITIPESVAEIGDYAFYCCKNLKNIKLGDGITKIGSSAFVYTAFYDDKSNWDEGVLYIDEYLLETQDYIVWYPDETGFTSGIGEPSHKIKEGTRVIADLAYENCYDSDDYHTEDIYIPSSIISIGTGAFERCSNVNNVYFEGTEEEWNQITIEEGNEPILNATIHFLDESEHKHELTHRTVVSTCTVAGMEYDICLDCGESFNVVTLPLASHTWSEWMTRTEATGSAEGEKYRLCSVCGKEETNSIPKLNVIEDKKTGIEIEFNDEYDSGVEIKVEEVFDGNSFELLEKTYGGVKSKVFDISTIKDGIKVQPDGKVKVRIPLPKGFGKNSVWVNYIDSSNGTVEKIPATVVNGYVEFETDHFSYYAIVEKLGKVKSVSIDDISMSYKDSTTITPNISVDAGVDYTVTYSSSNTDVISIDANGKLTTNGKGSATITVTVTDEYGNTVTDTCKVNVSYKWWQWIIVIVLFGWIWY